MFIILIIFFLLVVCFFVFSLFLLYHAIRFGVASWVNVFTIILYLLGTAMLVIVIYMYVISIDWNQTIRIL